MAMMMPDSVWVLTDGKAGMASQARGLAERIGLPFVEKRIAPSVPWRWIAPGGWPPGVMGQGADGDPLAPPWPAVVISCGRQAVGPALEIKRRSGGRTLAVHIQHPRAGVRRFDLIAAPSHDALSGDNVVVTRGSLHGITAARLEAAAARHAARLAHLGRPRVAVLIGGSNKVYRLTPAVVGSLVSGLVTLCRRENASLLVTPSRRTGAGAETSLRTRLASTPSEIWDGRGENPYHAYLGLADHIVVTCDSVNMISEACSTGKPVHVVALEGRGDSKFDRFQRDLHESGMTRPFRGTLESWHYEPLDETARVAAAVRERLDARR